VSHSPAWLCRLLFFVHTIKRSIKAQYRSNNCRSTSGIHTNQVNNSGDSNRSQAQMTPHDLGFIYCRSAWCKNSFYSKLDVLPSSIAVTAALICRSECFSPYPQVRSISVLNCIFFSQATIWSEITEFSSSLAWPHPSWPTTCPGQPE
jgi:hypothetical protein